ncbi:MAG: hypothetical protein ACRD59_15620, partial [Candidatus Acidiferrales bacterium]
MSVLLGIEEANEGVELPDGGGERWESEARTNSELHGVRAARNVNQEREFHRQPVERRFVY